MENGNNNTDDDVQQLTDSDKDSADVVKCPICFREFEQNDPYAVIDNNNEKGKYCVDCLETWLHKSNNGLLTQDVVTSYSIYYDDKLIITNVVKDPKLTDYIINISDDVIITPLIDNHHMTTNNNRDCCRMVMLLCIFIMICILIIIISGAVKYH